MMSPHQTLPPPLTSLSQEKFSEVDSGGLAEKTLISQKIRVYANDTLTWLYGLETSMTNKKK